MGIILPVVEAIIEQCPSFQIKDTKFRRLILSTFSGAKRKMEDSTQFGALERAILNPFVSNL
jgi:hypothetical protein